MIGQQDELVSAPSGALVDDYGLPQQSRHPLAALQGSYGDHGLFWGIAPVDPIAAAQHGADDTSCEFVWLVRAGRFTWALVHVADHRVIAADPKPRDTRTRAALAWRNQAVPLIPEGAS